MVIKEVGVHVGQCGEREIDSAFAVSMDVNPIFSHVQGRSDFRGSVSHALITDKRHSIIIDIGHPGLKESHLVGECLEIIRSEHISVDVDDRGGVGVGKGIFPNSRMAHGHGRPRKNNRLEISD